MSGELGLERPSLLRRYDRYRHAYCDLRRDLCVCVCVYIHKCIKFYIFYTLFNKLYARSSSEQFPSKFVLPSALTFISLSSIIRLGLIIFLHDSSDYVNLRLSYNKFIWFDKIILNISD